MGPRGVHGNLVLVTDGWDNASARFDVSLPGQAPPPSGRVDLVTYMLPPQSALTLRVIGIGSGMERDKGVDGARIQELLDQMTRARAGAGPPGGVQLPGGHDGLGAVRPDGQRVPRRRVRRTTGRIEDLHPEELAQHAASAARALKEPQQHATVSRIRSPGSSRPRPRCTYRRRRTSRSTCSSPARGAARPPYLKERYGPLGEVVEAYLARDSSTRALALDRTLGARPSPGDPPLLGGAGPVRPAGRSSRRPGPCFRRGTRPKSSRPTSQTRILRRLALLQARMQNDKETETLVRFIDDTEQRLARCGPEVRDAPRRPVRRS